MELRQIGSSYPRGRRGTSAKRYSPEMVSLLGPNFQPSAKKQNKRSGMDDRVKIKEGLGGRCPRIRGTLGKVFMCSSPFRCHKETGSGEENRH